MAEKRIGYDLEERTFKFALAVRRCLAGSRWTRVQWRDLDQLLRASGSVAANYTEANNALSKPDFLHRIRIAKKEACETRLWLRLLGATSSTEEKRKELKELHSEVDELIKILAAIHRNSESEPSAV